MTTNQTRKPNGQFDNNKPKAKKVKKGHGGTILTLIIVSLIGYGVYQSYKGPEYASETSQDCSRNVLTKENVHCATLPLSDTSKANLGANGELDEKDAQKVEIYRKKLILEKKKNEEVARHESVLEAEKTLNIENMQKITTELANLEAEAKSLDLGLE